MTKNQGTVFLLGQVEMCTRAIMKTTVEMDMEKCIGMMAAFTRDSGKMGFNMVKERYMFQDQATKRAHSKTMFLW